MLGIFISRKASAVVTVLDTSDLSLLYFALSAVATTVYEYDPPASTFLST